jgi:membrane protein
MPYIFRKQFWKDFRSNPKLALDGLRERKNKFWYEFFKFIIFWRVTFSEYLLNHSLTRASAMGFVLLLTLIPLITITAIMFTSVMEIHPRQVERILSLFLPFAPQALLNYISEFFTNAKKLRGISVGVLIVMTLSLFGVVEESFNTIWKVTRARSFFIRLRTFTMVMVYSPVLFFTSFQLRRSIGVGSLHQLFFPFDFLPFFMVVLAFTTLIWFVPNTRVRFSAAFIGGLISGTLFEIERQGFGHYVRVSIQTQTIYGAFGILSFFLISLFVASLFILFGAQIAYVYQNFKPLLRAKQRWDRRVGDYRTYITIRMFIDALTAFIKKMKPPDLAHLSRKYELTDAQATGILNWLVHAELLHKVSGKDSYVPTRDFSNTPVKEVFDLIEDVTRHITPEPADYTKKYLEGLMGRLKTCTGNEIGELTFAQMIAAIESGDRHATRVTTVLGA